MNVIAFGVVPETGRPYLRVHIAAITAFVALAALILNPIFGSMAALLFLMAGLALIGSQPERSVAALVRHWYVLILPAFCILSVLWSQYAGLSLRYGIQLALTVAIAIVIASRVPPLMFLRCLYGIYWIGIAGSLLFGRVRDDIGALIGIFGSKNAFAAVVAGFLITSIAIFFDRTASRAMRASALAGVALSIPLFVWAQSAGWMLYALPGAAMTVALVLSRHMSPMQKLLAGAIVACAAVFAALGVAGYGDVMLENLLEFTEKDATLTGRTDLWEYGLHVIAERPLLGLGYQAFWVHGYEPAEMLWAMFGIESRMGFNFHNTYISNAVEIGIVGLCIQVALLYGALFKTVAWALRQPGPESAFFAGFVATIVASSFGEVPVYFQFSVTSVIAICALVYAVRAKWTPRRG
jgi:exopolysaccharide production protein ExoQ